MMQMVKVCLRGVSTLFCVPKIEKLHEPMVSQEKNRTLKVQTRIGTRETEKEFISHRDRRKGVE